MILTKLQIIHTILEESIRPTNKIIKRFLNIPEHIFLDLVYKELHWKLDPIRKNTYIIII